MSGISNGCLSLPPPSPPQLCLSLSCSLSHSASVIVCFLRLPVPHRHKHCFLDKWALSPSSPPLLILRHENVFWSHVWKETYRSGLVTIYIFLSDNRCLCCHGGSKHIQKKNCRPQTRRSREMKEAFTLDRVCRPNKHTQQSQKWGRTERWLVTNYGIFIHHIVWWYEAEEEQPASIDRPPSGCRCDVCTRGF